MLPSLKIHNIIDVKTNMTARGDTWHEVQLSTRDKFLTRSEDRRITRLDSILEQAEIWEPIPRWMTGYEVINSR